MNQKKEKTNINKHFIVSNDDDLEGVEEYFDDMLAKLGNFKVTLKECDDKVALKIKAIKITEDKCLINIKFKSKK